MPLKQRTLGRAAPSAGDEWAGEAAGSDIASECSGALAVAVAVAVAAAVGSRVVSRRPRPAPRAVRASAAPCPVATGATGPARAGPLPGKGAAAARVR
jgi:hypothetical protein